MYDKLDAFLLKKFQKMSDWFQFGVGLNNFHLAKITLTLALACFLETQIQKIFWKGWSALLIIGMILGTAAYFYITYRIKLGEKNCHQNPLLQSTLSIDLALFREFSITAVIYFTVRFAMKIPFSGIETADKKHEFFYWLFIWLASLMEFLTFYFASCTPKPPKPSKLKELLEKPIPKPQVETI